MKFGVKNGFRRTSIKELVRFLGVVECLRDSSKTTVTEGLAYLLKAEAGSVSRLNRFTFCNRTTEGQDWNINSRNATSRTPSAVSPWETLGPPHSFIHVSDP